MFVSYAQNLEDVILRRCFPGPSGFYVDVGASHPVLDSVTMGFYEAGWSGLNIEPVPERIAELDYCRPRDTNLRMALAEAPGRATFHVFPRWYGLSTLDGDIAADMRRWGDEAVPVEVEISTLADVLAEQSVEAIDFLKIDVEGAEGRVIAGMDFARWRPVVLLVEATYPTTAEPRHEGWEPAVLAAGYRLVLFDGLNRFYLREESADLAPRFAVPPNVFDDFVRARSLGRPLRNLDHPDHAFARHLAETWLEALHAASDGEFLRLFTSGLPEAQLAKPASEAAIGEAHRRVFGRDLTPELLAELGGRPLGEAYERLVRSDAFRAARARVGMGG
jgi:FkbM family methyltransferase